MSDNSFSTNDDDAFAGETGGDVTAIAVEDAADTDEQAEVAPGDQAEVAPGDQAEVAPGDQAEVQPGDETAGAADGQGSADQAADEGGEEEAHQPAAPESAYDRPGQWFVIHSYAGYENKVKSNLESRIASMNMEERIFEVVIPMEDVIEFKNGKKQVVSKKVFPGYLMVRLYLDDDSWYVVRNTPGVTGFVGLGARPTPLTRREVENILQVKAEEARSREPYRPRGGG